MSQQLITEWPKEVLSRISYEIHLVSFANAVDVEEWRKLFKPCAAQRLFLPVFILSSVQYSQVS